MKTAVFRPFRQLLVLAAACLLVGGCASGPKITAEADPQADFSRYRTYAFYSPLAIEKEGYASPVSARMKEAVRAQMESRGYVMSADAPDLWVNINGYTREQTDVTSMPTMDYGMYYSYRRGGYLVAPYWSERTQVYRYTEGTLNIDIVDVARKQLAWEGVAVGRVTASKDSAQRDAKIDATVADIFAKYPYRAGSGAAVSP